MPYRPLVTLATIGIIATWPMPAQAQGAVAGRSGGLFGATRSDATDRNRFNVTFAATEGFDSEVPAELRTGIPSTGPQSGGWSTMLTTAAEYMNAGRRLQIGGAAQSAVRIYHQLDSVSYASHSGSVHARLQLARSAAFQVAQTLAYSPSYLFELFPDAELPRLEDPIAVNPEYRVRETESYVHNTSVTLDVGAKRGSSFAVSGNFGQTTFSSQALERPTLRNYGGQARYSQGIRRNVNLSAGYEYRGGELNLAPFAEQRLSIGAQYSLALSTSRRATFRFDVSPSWLDVPETSGAPFTGRARGVHGSLALDYQFLRTWRASAAYSRSFEYVAVLAEPVVANSARVDLSGLIGRRLDVAVSAGYSVGESALSLTTDELETYTGTSTMRFALTRGFALFTEYFYYVYDDRGQSLLAPQLPSQFEQHGVRVGATVWVPVF
jgi:hypothetical protein